MSKALLIFMVTVPGIIHCQGLSEKELLQMAKSNPEQAIGYLDSLAAASGFTEDHPMFYRISGIAYLGLKNSERATEQFQSSLKKARLIYDRSAQAKALYHLARLEAQAGNFDGAIVKADSGAVLARGLDDPLLEYRLNNLLSWGYFSTERDFHQVLRHEARQVELVKQLDESSYKAHVYNNLGYDLTVAGTVHLDSAISLIQFANAFYSEGEGSCGRWYTLMNLMWQHRLKGELKRSEEYGNLALEAARSIEDRHAIVETCFQLGETLVALKMTDSAASCYELGKRWANQTEDRDKYVFDVYYASYLKYIGQAEEAIALLESAVRFLENSEVFYEMHGRAILASLYFDQGDEKKSWQQVNAIRDPRHNYIAMETRLLAALVTSKLLLSEGETEVAKILLDNWQAHAEEIGAGYLVEFFD